MDLVHYDLALPDSPPPRGLPPGTNDRPAPGFDWASYVIRLAQAVAERDARPA